MYVLSGSSGRHYIGPGAQVARTPARLMPQFEKTRASNRVIIHRSLLVHGRGPRIGAAAQAHEKPQGGYGVSQDKEQPRLKSGLVVGSSPTRPTAPLERFQKTCSHGLRRISEDEPKKVVPADTGATSFTSQGNQRTDRGGTSVDWRPDHRQEDFCAGVPAQNHPPPSSSIRGYAFSETALRKAGNSRSVILPRETS